MRAANAKIRILGPTEAASELRRRSEAARLTDRSGRLERRGPVRRHSRPSLACHVTCPGVLCALARSEHKNKHTHTYERAEYGVQVVYTAQWCISTKSFESSEYISWLASNYRIRVYTYSSGESVWVDVRELIQHLGQRNVETRSFISTCARVPEFGISEFGNAKLRT